MCIDVLAGVPGVLKNPDDLTWVHSGELEQKDSVKIEETVKNHQNWNWTKMIKKTLFSEGFLNSIQFELNLSASTD